MKHLLFFLFINQTLFGAMSALKVDLKTSTLSYQECKKAEKTFLDLVDHYSFSTWFYAGGFDYQDNICKCDQITFGDSSNINQLSSDLKDTFKNDFFQNIFEIGASVGHVRFSRVDNSGYYTYISPATINFPDYSSYHGFHFYLMGSSDKDDQFLLDYTKTYFPNIYSDLEKYFKNHQCFLQKNLSLEIEVDWRDISGNILWQAWQYYPGPRFCKKSLMH